jgi:hypothetical protein
MEVAMPDAPSSSVAAAPPQGAPVDLRPLNTSELIDRGFALYRSHFAGCLLIALLCQTAPLLTSQALLAAFKTLPAQADLMDRPNTDLVKVVVLLVIWLVGQVVTFGFEVVLTYYLADAYLGRVPSVKAGLRKLMGCLAASLWTCLLNIFLVALTMLFPLLAGAAVYIYGQVYPPQQFLTILVFFGAALLLFVASLVPLLIVFMRLMLTVPAVALENLSGWQAVKRSSQLVRFDPGLGILYWGEMRLSFLLLPLFVIEMLALSLTSLPLTLHQINEVLRHGAIGQVVAPPESAVILSQILVLFAGSLLLPLYLIATTLFYYDVRIRREGFDLEFLAGRLETKP